MEATSYFQSLLMRRQPLQGFSTTFLTEESSAGAAAAKRKRMMDELEAFAPLTECPELPKDSFPPDITQKAVWRFIPDLVARNAEDAREAREVYGEVTYCTAASLYVLQ